MELPARDVSSVTALAPSVLCIEVGGARVLTLSLSLSLTLSLTVSVYLSRSLSLSLSTGTGAQVSTNS